MPRIVETLLLVSLRSTLAGLAVAAFCALMRKRLSARLRYGLYFLLLARLLLPVDIPLDIQFGALLPAQAAAVQAAPAPSLPPAPVLLESPAAAPLPAAPAAAPVLREAAAVPGARMAWQEAAFWLWLAGMLVYASWLCFAQLRFRRRLRALRRDCPAQLLSLYAACRKTLRLRAEIPLCVVDAAISPGLAFLFRPTLLLPIDICENPKGLRYALLHELSHYKRCDHIVNALLVLLRGLHWFNPAIQLLLSEMGAAMESACDAMAMEALGREEKRGYLETLIALSGRQALPQLGMGAQRGPRQMRRRLQSAFLRPRSALGVRLGALLFALLLFLACFTIACAPVSAAAPPGPQAPAAPAADAAAEESAPQAQAPAGETLRASYTLRVDAATADYAAGKANLFERAAARINEGAAIEPGATWSFNAAMGLQSPGDESLSSDGWRKGGADGISGLDWMASALYGALLSGDIEIVEAKQHAFPQAYAQPGMDVCITSGMDLKFRNNSAAPLRLHIRLLEEAQGLTLCASIEGAPIAEGLASYSLYSRVVERVPMGEPDYTEDPSLPAGLIARVYEGQDGCTVEVYRQPVKHDGKWAGAEELYASCTYRALRPLYAIGTGSAAAGPAADASGQIAALREAAMRLLALGYLDQADWHKSYDENFKRAVSAFQKAQGLEADGILGPATHRALLSPAAKQAPLHTQAVPPDFLSALIGTGSKIAEAAAATPGKAYAPGADGPEAFDGAGLLYWCLHSSGLDVERMDCAGYAAMDGFLRIETMDGLQPGDLLFFRSLSPEADSIHHAGVYVGQGKMAHASSSAGRVLLTDTSSQYCTKGFSHALRPL